MSFDSEIRRPFGAGITATLPPMGAGVPISAVSRVALRHLRTPAEIQRVLPLREGIDLSVHQSAGQAFTDLEKKETNSASSVRSSSTAN